MHGNDLWARYCSFYEKPFSEQMEYNTTQMERYFKKWQTTDFVKLLHRGMPFKRHEVPVTTYDDYPMLTEFSRKITEASTRTPREKKELCKDYYERMTHEFGPSLDPYMVEPYYFAMKTTGTMGESKWVAHSETFWKNFTVSSLGSAIIACSEGWGETSLREGDRAINVTAPIPYISGWGLWATSTHLRPVPPIEVTDNLRDMRETVYLLLNAIRKGEQIAIGGGLGSLFYMICKYFVNPEEFYEEYYVTMSTGLRKILLFLKLLQLKWSKKESRKIVEFMPLKGVTIGGLDSRLYIDFFKEEFNVEPLNNYGSTEVGSLMRGDPDRKSDLVPDLRTGYIEFLTEEGEVRGLDEVKRGKRYELVVTPFGSIFFRYNMEDLFRVVDVRDDGMPIFAFEGRKKTVIRLYNYDVTPHVMVQALAKAGLKASDKWTVIKLLKPHEHLHILMEKTWSYSEREAEALIFKSLLEEESNLSNPDDLLLRDYVADFRIKDPSDVVKVEYLKPGAFLRYTMRKTKEGSPLGQCKPPKIIPSEQMDIYDALMSV